MGKEIMRDGQTAPNIRFTLRRYALLCLPRKPAGTFHTRGCRVNSAEASALERIIDQYKPRKIDDATIVEKFNDYSYGLYKEGIVRLIKKILTVSVETVNIMELMREEE